MGEAVIRPLRECLPDGNSAAPTTKQPRDCRGFNADEVRIEYRQGSQGTAVSVAASATKRAFGNIINHAPIVAEQEQDYLEWRSVVPQLGYMIGR